MQHGTEQQTRERELEARLAECEEMLDAIRTGAIDALVISGQDGERVYTLKGAELPYRILVESMNEGALTLTGEGMVLYSNSRFADMVRMPLERVIGASFLSFVLPDNHALCAELFTEGLVAGSRGEIRLRAGTDAVIPAILSFRPLGVNGMTGISLVVTDITEQKEAEQSLRSMRDRLRSLATELTRAEERERKRIATYLHDRIGHTLALAQFRIEDLQGRIPSRDHDEDFDTVLKSIAQAIDETRTLTAQLYPPVLYELGFAAAVDWLGEQIHRQYGVRVEVSAGKTYQSLQNELRGTLFQAVRELIFNAVKHASPTLVTVNIDQQEETIQVAVEDNGAGFDVRKLNSPAAKGFGLFSLRERITVMGGTLDISSNEGEGTRAVLRMPSSV